MLDLKLATNFWRVFLIKTTLPCQSNIKRLPYADLIRRYDHTDTLFYFDPPYWECEDDHGNDAFSRDDFSQLADQLAGIAGKFVLSINAAEGSRGYLTGSASWTSK